MTIVNEDDYLAHYGILRKSGRYPWGSGGTQEARNQTFLETIKALRDQGMSEADIARGFDMSTTQLRALRSIAKNQQKQSQITQAMALKEKGYSNGAIAERMGLAGESSVRALLEPSVKDRADILVTTSDMLKRQVDEKGFIDIGTGVEHHVGVSKEKLNTAVAMLEEQGYMKLTVKERQLGTGLETEIKVLAPPGTTQRDVFLNKGDIKQIREFSDDGGRSYNGFKPPLAVDPKRVAVNYSKKNDKGEEIGGGTADGVIYVRPGISDLSLGNARYAQVRIQVGDGHYLKGMAMYKDDLPDGVDLLFNTNKSDTGNKLDAMKGLKDDADLPFGAVVRQILDKPGDPNAKVVSAMNIVNDEGRWSEWSRNLSSQMLSKQTTSLARSQLDMTHERRKKELDEIMALTNPTVKKKLLESYADSTDSAAVHLKAAALPRQATHVILPVNSMPPSQVYAPNYRDGERVVLIRFPHGGTFEIPELTVNNKHAEAKKLLGEARDAIGIHHSVAERLSGADFDGDTVLVIPNNSNRVTTTRPLEGLKNFDPRASYPAYEGMPKLSNDRKQQLMGDVSNLITDMTLRGASHSDLVRAVRHSMVVIDAEKHNLNYKESAIRNGNPQLKQQYQGGARAGASTLLSKKKSVDYVPERKPRPQKDGGPIDKATGKRVYVETGRINTNAKGVTAPRKQKVNKLDDTDDANLLSSGTPMEKLYASHSNNLKALANKARLEAIRTPPLQYSPSAKKAYAKEVTSLNAKLALAKSNAPLERQAQIIGNSVVRAKRAANPDLDRDTIEKIKYQALEEARIRTGAKKQQIQITDKEWNAIQAGAVSNSKLNEILTNADLDGVRKLATPRKDVLMTSAKTQRAQSMLASGYTRAEVADALGVSLTTLDNATVATE